MLISVIIPTYNRAQCIGRALESVTAQGIADMELIIGDDASTDGTLEMIGRLLPEAVIVRLPVNQGAAAARNAALKMARGDLIAFLDSDDEWLPGKLERQISFLKERPEVQLCGTGHFLVARDGSRIEFPGNNPTDWREELQSAQSFHGASTPVIRRSVLESVGLQDEKLRVLEDWDWMLRIASKHPIHVLPEMLVLIHENSPSNPVHTAEATRYFLSKHHEEFLHYGPSHARNVVSQHYENAARNLFRHQQAGKGASMLWKSVVTSPLRNPASLAAFPLAAFDFLSGTHLLPAILARRNRLPLRHP